MSEKFEGKVSPQENQDEDVEVRRSTTETAFGWVYDDDKTGEYERWAKESARNQELAREIFRDAKGK